MYPISISSYNAWIMNPKEKHLLALIRTNSNEVIIVETRELDACNSEIILQYKDYLYTLRHTHCAFHLSTRTYKDHLKIIHSTCIRNCVIKQLG
jgi:hypothetical protein